MIPPPAGRTSTFSNDTGTCVQLARRPDGRVLVRNSNRPAGAMLVVDPAALGAWVAGCRAGDLDDLRA